MAEQEFEKICFKMRPIGPIILLAFLVFGTLGYSQVSPNSVTQRTFEIYFQSLSKFKVSCGRFPTTKEGFHALIDQPKNLKCKGYPELGFINYNADSPNDGWGQKMKYKSNGKSYRITASHGYYLTEKSSMCGYGHCDNPNPPPEGNPFPSPPPGMQF